jgi:1,4-alpha-glucan branching enzyme
MGIPKGKPKKTARTRTSKKPIQPKTKQVAFRWTIMGANTVNVAGEFNNWDRQAHPLKKAKDGTWKVTLRLKPGSYEYMFVVDGQWRDDPLNPNRVPDPLGGFNSACEVA